MFQPICITTKLVIQGYTYIFVLCDLAPTWRQTFLQTYHIRLYSFVVKSSAKLTHWGRVTHICVGNLTIIGPDNGLSPGRRQAIFWTNAGIWLIGPWGTNFSEILIGIQTFSFKKIHLKMSSAKWRPILSRPQCVKRVKRDLVRNTGALFVLWFHVRHITGIAMNKLSWVS